MEKSNREYDRAYGFYGAGVAAIVAFVVLAMLLPPAAGIVPALLNAITLTSLYFGGGLIMISGWHQLHELEKKNDWGHDFGPGFIAA